MRAGLVQLNVGDDPAENLVETRALVRAAAAGGAGFVLTPEVTNCLSSNRAHQTAVLRHEQDDLTLAALREDAAHLGIWLLIGSLGLKTHDDDGRFANRSFLIAPDGAIAARYDKIHMFDVNVSETEVYRESAGYRPGTRAVVAETPFATLGLSVCYDVRFPYLYRALAKAGAEVLTVPAAFNHDHRRGPIGRPCCGPARSRPAATCWRRRRWANIAQARARRRVRGRARRGEPMATAWPWRPGARCWPMPARRSA